MNNKKAISILLLTIFIDLLGFGLVIPVLPTFSKEIGLEDAYIGVVVAVYSVMQFIFTPIWGAISDRVGRRPIILVSILITMIAYILLGLTSTIPMLILARTFAGIGSGNIGTAQAYINDITRPEHRAKAQGLIGMAFGLGFVFGPLIGGWIKQHFGMHILGFTTAGLCFLNFVLAYFVLDESLKPEFRMNRKITNPLTQVLDGFKDKKKFDVLMITFLYLISFSSFYITCNLLWKDKYEVDEVKIGYLFATLGFCTAITQGILIRIFTKFWNEVQLFYIGMVIMILCFIAIPFVPKEYFYICQISIIALFSIANGMVSPSSIAVMSKISTPETQGINMGIYQSVSALSRVFGPLMATPLYAMNWNYPFFLATIVLMVTFFFVFRLDKKLSIEVSKT